MVRLPFTTSRNIWGGGELAVDWSVLVVTRWIFRQVFACPCSCQGESWLLERNFVVCSHVRSLAVWLFNRLPTKPICDSSSFHSGEPRTTQDLCAARLKMLGPFGIPLLGRRAINLTLTRRFSQKQPPGMNARQTLRKPVLSSRSRWLCGYLSVFPSRQSVAQGFFKSGSRTWAEAQMRGGYKIPWPRWYSSKKRCLRRQAINPTLPKQVKASSQGSAGFSDRARMLGFPSTPVRRPWPMWATRPDRTVFPQTRQLGVCIRCYWRRE